MARARPRYIIKGKMSANDVDLRGQEVVLMGESTWEGRLKKRGDAKYSHLFTHYLFRIEDKKFLRANKILHLSLFTLKKGDEGRFLVEKDKT